MPAPAPESRTLSKGDRTRARILESGFELFLSRGSHSVSLRQIAAAAGLSPMAIYRHFDDKAALQFALLEHAFTTFEQFLRASPGGEDPMDDLRLLATQFFRFAFERAPQFRFLFLSDARAHEPKQERDLASLSRPAFDLLHDCVRLCVKEGSIRTTNTHTLSLDLLGFCVGRAALVLSGNLDTPGQVPLLSATEAFVRYMDLLSRESLKDY